MPDPKSNLQDTIKNANRINQHREGTGEDKRIKYATLTQYTPKKGEDVKPTTVGGKPYKGKLYSKVPDPRAKYGK